jgi:hypothetical protein
MTIIKVPRPPQSAMDPNRPVSGLLKAQILQLHTAEKNLPLRYRTDIYINAIKTEGEAADYVGRVTAAIHEAHRSAAAKRGRGIAIAAAADERPVGTRPGTSPGKKKSKMKRGRKG